MNSCNDNSPHSVIEINNPESLILFHKVVIPSSLGDETQTPPYPGKYCNVLAVYETNGHSYLYSSDGIPTALGFDSGGILVVDEFPEVEQAAQGFLYIKRDTGEAQITTDNQNWTIIAGHYGAVYAVDAQPDAADAEPDSLYVNYATGEAWLTHDNTTWVTISDDHHDVLLVENFPDVADAELNVLYVSSTDQEARITNDNIHWVTISGGGSGGTSDFDQLSNRPKYAGQTMTSSTDIPDFSSQISSLSSSLSDEADAREQADLALQSSKQDKLVAGNNIQISATNVISATDTTYTAGDNIEISADNEISAKIPNVYGFDTVADMKASTELKVGDYAITAGFYSANDGGGAKYEITDTGTANEMDVIAVSNLYANLICDEANPLQFGAYGDNTHNDTAALQACFDYANDKKIPIYVPGKTYLSDTTTITEVKHIKIDGVINLSSDSQFLNVFESTQDYACNIYINRVNTGTILIKGLNTADVRIQKAWRVTLLADNTPNHGWIAYSKFYLGFTTELNIVDDGSGVKYINENLFIGGRFARVNIGTGDSGYRHENNLFLKCLCESTTFTFGYAKGNIFDRARIEGASIINFGPESYANVINQEWADTKQGYYYPKEIVRSNITINDNSNGSNNFYTNSGVNEQTIRRLSYYDNPNNIATDDYRLAPAISDPFLYQSDIIKLPEKGIFCISLFGDNAQLSKLIIRCYDENKNLISTAPTESLLINSPQLVWSSLYRGYANVTYTAPFKWGIIQPNNPEVKYIDVKVMAISGGTQRYYKYLNLVLTSYDKINTDIIQGLSKSVTPD